MWAQRGRESKAGDSDPEERGGGAEARERTRRDSDRGQTKGRQGGAVKSGSWGALGGSQGDRPQGIPEVPAYTGDTKRGKTLKK